MSTERMPSPDLFFEVIFAYQRSAALKAAIELDVFTAIGNGAGTVREIADRCKAKERGTRILCDNLTIMGFLTKTGDTYQLTRDSAVFLTKRSPAYLGGTVEFLLSPDLMGSVEGLTETIRRGTVASASANIVADEHPAWVRFARAMVPMMLPPAQAIAEILEVASAGPMRVLDIAAGHGIFGLVIAERNPSAEVVSVDWAPVLTVAAENAEAMGVSARYRSLPGDAFKVEYGTGFDVALITNFLHHFDRRTCIVLLKKMAGALKNGGRVVILEFVPNDDRISPPFAAGFSLQMLLATPSGDAYTFRDLQGMLAEAGFTNVTAHPLPGPQTVIVGTK